MQIYSFWQEQRGYDIGHGLLLSKIGVQTGFFFFWTRILGIKEFAVVAAGTQGDASLALGYGRHWAFSPLWASAGSFSFLQENQENMNF